MHLAASAVSQLYRIVFPSMCQILFRAVYYKCVFCIYKVVINFQNPCDKPNEIITWKRFNQRAWQRCIKPGRG